MNFRRLLPLPNDTELYGPWAGKILFGYSWPSSFKINVDVKVFFFVDTNGFIVSYDGFEASGLSIIPPNENLYTVDAHNGIVWGTSASKLQGVVGNILMTDTEQTYGNDTMFAVQWNGQAFLKNHNSPWQMDTGYIILFLGRRLPLPPPAFRMCHLHHTRSNSTD